LLRQFRFLFIRVDTIFVSATEKFHFGINLGLAKYYSDAISDSVKRVNEQKVRKGELTGKPPIGYISVYDVNDKRIDVIPDPARAHLVVKMFEMYATGNYSIRQIRNEMEKLGLKSNTKNPKPSSAGKIYNDLKNPFYYGQREIKKGALKGLHDHKYQPIVLKALFEKCQEVMAGYHKKPFKYASKPFVLRGMIKCADCGCTITPEIQKEHNYYSCTNYRRMHGKRIYVREEELLSPIYEVLKNIQLSDEKIQEITEDLKKSNQAKNEFHKQSLTTFRKEYDLYQKRIDNSFDLMADGSITTDMFNKKLKEYKEKQAELEAEMARYTNADENYYITANTVLNLAKRAYEIFKSSEVAEKRQLLNFLLQNLELKGRKLMFTMKTPFDTVLSANRCSNWLPGWDDVRTCFQSLTDHFAFKIAASW